MSAKELKADMGEGDAMIKVLLLCAGGVSSSIVMKRLRTYAAQMGIDCVFKATGTTSFREVASHYDCILLAPQMRYCLSRVKRESSKPVGIIAPADYGVGDVENIFKLIFELIAQGTPPADRAEGSGETMPDA